MFMKFCKFYNKLALSLYGCLVMGQFTQKFGGHSSKMWNQIETTSFCDLFLICKAKNTWKIINSSYHQHVLYVVHFKVSKDKVGREILLGCVIQILCNNKIRIMADAWMGFLLHYNKNYDLHPHQFINVVKTCHCFINFSSI